MRKRNMLKNPLKALNKQEFYTIIGVIVIITLLSVLIIILSMQRRNIKDSTNRAQSVDTDRIYLQRSMGFGIEDYYRDSRDTELQSVYPIYQRHKTWLKDEIDAFWIDPLETGMATLSEDNDNRISDSLGIDNR